MATRLRSPFPETPPPGPFRRDFWRSPLRGPWLATVLSVALLPLIVICALTGFLSHAAYDPNLGSNASHGGRSGGFDLYFFNWPSSPAWLYAVNQGLHVVSGITAIPILLAKLWAVIPQLFEWPPVRSLAHGLERLGLALLVGGSLFVFFTGIMNIQLYYPWGFGFVPAHYYAAFVFLAALAAHIVLKLPIARRALARMGTVAPLREGIADTRPELPDTADEHSSAPSAPAQPTISRRGLLAAVGAGSAGVGVIAAAQSIGGPLRPLGVLAPRGKSPGDGPNDFQVNQTAMRAGIDPKMTGDEWRLTLSGTRDVSLSREQLLALPQSTERLPIACVEGWSTTQDWTGVRLPELARMAGIEEIDELFIESLQESGAFRQVTLSPGQAAQSRALIALKVNGVDLSPNHGFPARLIVPAAPGVHNTKWVAKMTWKA